VLCIIHFQSLSARLSVGQNINLYNTLTKITISKCNKNMTTIFYHIKAIFIQNLLTEDPDDFHAKVISEHMPDINCFLFGQAKFSAKNFTVQALKSLTDVKTSVLSLTGICVSEFDAKLYSSVEFNHNSHKITNRTM
jgi:hypothetical protein